MAEFDDLVASRKAWITDFLQPWCRSAPLAALKRAELDWADIAGKVTADKTLWPWAWARFPDLVHETLGIEETTEVQVILNDGHTVRGYPDARASLQGQLVLWGSDPAGTDPRELGPYSIDRVAKVSRILESDSN